MRLLWARIGKPHCFNCGRPIAAQSAEQIIDQIMALEEGTRFMVLAPIVRGRKGEFRDQLEHLRAEGFTRVKVDGELDRKSTRLNSSHANISYAVFCLKKNKKKI